MWLIACTRTISSPTQAHSQLLPAATRYRGILVPHRCPLTWSLSMPSRRLSSTIRDIPKTHWGGWTCWKSQQVILGVQKAKCVFSLSRRESLNQLCTLSDRSSVGGGNRMESVLKLRQRRRQSQLSLLAPQVNSVHVINDIRWFHSSTNQELQFSQGINLKFGSPFLNHVKSSRQFCLYVKNKVTGRLG